MSASNKEVGGSYKEISFAKSSLYDLIIEKDWDGVETLLNSNKISKEEKDEAMQYQDEYGRTALMMAVSRQGASIDVVKSIVQKLGGEENTVLRIKDNDGS